VYLIGFQNRLLAVLRWTISFVTRGREARLIVDRTEAEVTPPSGIRTRRNGRGRDAGLRPSPTR
jgi:hypothetical protein